MQPVHETLKDIQRRLSVTLQRRVTISGMAEIGQANSRLVGDWLRGKSPQHGMAALLHWLSELPEQEVKEVIAKWRSDGREASTKDQ